MKKDKPATPHNAADTQASRATAGNGIGNGATLQ